MEDYNFEILRLKKEKKNNLFNIFIYSSFMLVFVFIIIMFINRGHDYIVCESIFNNDSGDFNYRIKYDIYNGKIYRIDGKQVVDLNINKASLELYNILSKNNIVSDEFTFDVSMVDDKVILDYRLNLLDGSKYLNDINALLGVEGIYVNTSIDRIVRKLEYKGYRCSVN